MTPFAWLFAVAFGGEVEIDSAITEVVVFQGSARVTRVATATIEPGRTDLVFDGLPLLLVTESLTAEGEGTAGGTILGIDTRPQRGTEERDAKVKALLDEKEGLSDEITALRDEKARIEGEVRFLTSVVPTAPEELEERQFLADDAADQIVAVAAQLGTDVRTLLAAQRKAEIAIRDLEKEVARIDREVAVVRGAGTDHQRVAVGIDAARAGKVTVRISYLVDGATWSPAYDARFRPDDNKVTLGLRGVVTQNTGESWDGVALKLSTADPSGSTAPPELSPFWLQDSYGYAATTAATGGATAVEFATSRKEDVPADGTARQVPLASLDLDAVVVHHVVARRVASAYLTARVENTAPYALLPGTVSSYLGGAYVGEGALALTPPGEDVDLSFGLDDRVEVERTRLQDVAYGTKPLGGREKQVYGFETVVTNRTGRPTTIEVTEQVPTSRYDRYTVSATTTPEAVVPKEGVFSWTVDLADGAEAKFGLQYEVSWPEGDRPVLLD